MAEVLNFALVGAAPSKARSVGVLASFQHVVDRYQNNLIALSVALKAAGTTPVEAAGSVDAALVTLQDGLIAAAAAQEDAYRV